uniref:Cytochrome P450 71D7 n=1 Tax=Aegilops tauschii subsp. strangulata TaxID=200361 RepID=A0A453T2M5_AEGTS
PMETTPIQLVSYTFLCVLVVTVLLKLRSASGSRPNLPPGPWALPVVGHMHFLLGALPHQAMRSLSRRHGPVMLLRLGHVPTLVLSSAEAARQLMKVHDAAFANRPVYTPADVFTNGGQNISFARHDSRHWKAVRKLCTVELLSPRRVRSFRPVREEEAARLVRSVADAGALVDVGERVKVMMNDVIMRDVFSAGSETTATTTIWAMPELIRNPRIMAIAQSEVRRVLQGKTKVAEADIDGRLHYLQMVIKETFRLHPPVPLLIPRLCTEQRKIMGFDVPPGTTVFANVWAIGRDEKSWTDAEEFKPERFESEMVDYGGTDFRFLPGGVGRRMCPGMMFGVSNIEIALASLLYHFNWRFPGDGNGNKLDMTEAYGMTTRRKTKLLLEAIAFEP